MMYVIIRQTLFPFPWVAGAEAAKGIGPVFLRLGRAGEPVVHNHQVRWELGKAITVGNQDYLRGIYGLTVDGIVENTIALLKNGTSKMQAKN